MDRGGPTAVLSLSFVVCLSDESLFQSNFLASPCLTEGSPHEVIAIRNPPSTAAGLAMGLARARKELVVCVHQDVFLPAGWDRQMLNQYRDGRAAVRADRGGGRVRGRAGRGRVGRSDPGRSRRADRPADRVGRGSGAGAREGPGCRPAVATLDELLLIVRRDSPLRFDPELGFHLYGADLCLQALEQGLAVVALGRRAGVIRGAWSCPGRFSTAPGLRPQVGAPAAAGGHAVRRVRPRGRAAFAGERGR